MVISCMMAYSNCRPFVIRFWNRRDSHSHSTIWKKARGFRFGDGSLRITWDDVFRIESDGVDSYANREYIDRVRDCNRGADLQSGFLPFLVEDALVGYIHNRFVNHIKGFEDVFVCPGNFVTLHPSLATPEDRTRAVGNVIKSLGELIPGTRNELFPAIPSFGMPAYFSLERAAVPYFGVKAYGVHVNGYVERDGKKLLWIGKRSEKKTTFPGMLDHLVAGGMPHEISCKDNVIKECEEEAGIPPSIAERAAPVGAISYMDIDGEKYKRDVLFCYDLKLSEDFVPKNQDSEVGSFQLIPVTQVAKIIQTTKFFKPNCAIVIIDFLFRHGYMNPDVPGYLELFQILRSGDCS